MALDFDGKYTPASNPADADYPYGSAVNDAVPGDKSGTPLDKDWLNDFLGFAQKLLNYANITPSGNPDTILASDYFNALVKRINAQSPYYVDSGAANALIVTGDPTFTAYVVGMKLRVKIAVTSTGAATINVDSLGVVNIKKRVSDALFDGDLQAGGIYNFTYDGTNFLIEFINHGHTAANDGGVINWGIRDTGRNLIIQEGGTPDEEVIITANERILQSVAGIPKRLTGINFTPDNTASGQNGMFTGAVAPNEMYAIWVTSGPSGSTAGFHLSSDLATVLGDAPAGYNTYGSKLGDIPTNGTSDFIPIYQEDNKVEYAATQLIKDGSFTSPAWTPENVEAFFPITAKRIICVLGGDNASHLGLSPRSDGMAGSYAYYQVTGSTQDFGGVFPTARESWTTHNIRYNGSTVYYRTGDVNSTLVGIGWEY